MLRLPAVAGQFYPADPQELSNLIRRYTRTEKTEQKSRVRACLVPHAGYIYSGAVAGAVFARVAIPKKVLLIGVRHYPRGEALAILSEGAWRTPLGDVPIDGALAKDLRGHCPELREDAVAHSTEHSLEVQLPFLQVLSPGFSFVPIAAGTIRFTDLAELGGGIAKALAGREDEILMVVSSDMNHYEDEETTRWKDQKAIEQMLKLDARGLFDACRQGEISMCGLGPAVVMLTVLNRMGAKHAELVRYGTSGETSGDLDRVVGYAGLTFN